MLENARFFYCTGRKIIICSDFPERRFIASETNHNQNYPEMQGDIWEVSSKGREARIKLGQVAIGHCCTREIRNWIGRRKWCGCVEEKYWAGSRQAMEIHSEAAINRVPCNSRWGADRNIAFQILPVSEIINAINILRYVLHTCNRDGASQMKLNV